MKLLSRIAGAGYCLLCFFGTNLYPGQTAEFLLKIGHSGTVNSVSYSSDGHYLATAGADNTIKIWDAERKTLLRTLASHEADIFSVAFCPNSKIIASAGYDKKILLWDIEHGEILQTLRAHTQPVTDLEFSNDGQFLISASRDSSIKIWHFKHGTLLDTLSGHQHQVNNLTVSHDDRLIASASPDHSIKIWQLQSHKLVKNLSNLNTNVTKIAFSPDGHLLAGAGANNTVTIWNVGYWQQLQVLTGFEKSVAAIAFSPDGRNLAVGGSGKYIELFNVQNLDIKLRLNSNGLKITDLTFSPDNKTLVAADADGAIHFYDVYDGELLHKIPAENLNIAEAIFSPKGNLLASTGSDGSILLWDLTSGCLQNTIPAHMGNVLSIAFHPDAEIIASAGSDGTIKTWHIPNNRQLNTLRGHQGEVNSIDFSPDGNRLVSAGDDKTVRVWGSTSGKLIHILSEHSARVWCAKLHPNGQLIASASDDYTIKLWNSTTGQLIKTLYGHYSLVRSVAFSHNGRYLVSASSDKTVNVWEVESGNLLRTLTGHNSSVKTATFSPDDNFVISGGFDNEIMIWDWRENKKISTLTGHTNDINQLNYSATGNRLVSCSPDGMIKIWDALSNRILLHIANLPDKQWAVFAENKLFYTGSDRAENYMGIRMDGKLDSVYPLSDFKHKLKKADIRNAYVADNPMLTGNDEPHGGEAVSFYKIFAWITLILGLSCLTTVIIIKIKINSENIIYKFFKKAGFRNLETISDNALVMNNVKGEAGVAFEWPNGHIDYNQMLNKLQNNKDTSTANIINLYLIYNGNPPIAAEIRRLRKLIKSRVIPVAAGIISKSLTENSCLKVLTQLKSGYTAGEDPYNDKNPVTDPNLFYGNQELLDRLSIALTHGENHCLIGLKKAGLTSIVNQLRYFCNQAPTVVIDCSKFSTKIELLYHELIKELHFVIRSTGSSSVPNAFEILRSKGFTQAILTLYQAWQKIDHRERFIIVLDEVDILNKKHSQNHGHVNSFIQFLKTLNNMAVNQGCLTYILTSHRPFEQWPNELKAEQTLLNNLTFEYISPLAPEDCQELVVGIGLWQNIIWQPDSAKAVFHYCHGNPWVARLFASHVCKNGAVKEITLKRIEQSFEEISNEILHHEIGHYFENSIWAFLTLDEKKLLGLICIRGAQGLNVKEAPSSMQDACINLENLGLIANDLGRLGITPYLFAKWLGKKLS